ncbi:MAG: hypothetical protein K2X93_16800 [Candidatus Obscuribacterales bacterium]|nr:hypothetical protein [Candidatus Obscuribacterales bacterium]
MSLVAGGSIVENIRKLVELSRRQTSTCTMSIAGATITLVFLDDGFQSRVVPAFSNTDVALKSDSDLTVLLVSRRQNQQLDEIFDAGMQHFSGHPNETLVSSSEGLQFVLQRSPEAMSIIDLANHFAVFIIDSPHALTNLERGNPLKHILSAFFCQREFLVLHSAAVAHHGATILIAGSSGSGKSTISAACWRSGWSFLSDDTTLCARTGTVYGVYRTLKLQTDQSAQFSIKTAGDKLIGEDKTVFFVPDDISLRASPPIARVLVFPVVSRQSHPVIETIPSGEALRRLLASSLFFLPVTKSTTTVNLLAELARTLPAYRLTLGRNPLEIPEVIASVLQ